MRPRYCLFGAMVAGSLITAPALADMSLGQTYEMSVVANPGLSLGGLRFSVEVSDAGLRDGEGARFRIINDSIADDSVITGVYFDDGVLLGIARVDNPDKGVWFAQDEIGLLGSKEFVAGGVVDFSTTAMFGAKFAAGVESPLPGYGVNSGEYVDIYFRLINGGTIADAIRQMNAGTIRVGVQLQGIGDTGVITASAMTPMAGPSIVPAPGAALLGLIGLSLVGWLKRRMA